MLAGREDPVELQLAKLNKSLITQVGATIFLMKQKYTKTEFNLLMSLNLGKIEKVTTGITA